MSSNQTIYSTGYLFVKHHRKKELDESLIIALKLILEVNL